MYYSTESTEVVSVQRQRKRCQRERERERGGGGTKTIALNKLSPFVCDKWQQLRCLGFYVNVHGVLLVFGPV